MSDRHPLDPHEIPDDADGGDLGAYIGEDLGRIMMLRVAVTVAIIGLVAGAMSESATPALKTACMVAGCAGVVLLLVAQLFRWPRRIQWFTIGGVMVACAGLLAAVFVGSR
ncbi:MAG: hypothetical protein V9G04_12050 [Nocardioides sp.]